MNLSRPAIYGHPRYCQFGEAVQAGQYDTDALSQDASHEFALSSGNVLQIEGGSGKRAGRGQLDCVKIPNTILGL